MDDMNFLTGIVKVNQNVVLDKKIENQLTFNIDDMNVLTEIAEMNENDGLDSKIEDQQIYSIDDMNILSGILEMNEKNVGFSKEEIDDLIKEVQKFLKLNSRKKTAPVGEIGIYEGKLFTAENSASMLKDEEYEYSVMKKTTKLMERLQKLKKSGKGSLKNKGQGESFFEEFFQVI